jgi:tRNA-specific 2-thiouridylase
MIYLDHAAATPVSAAASFAMQKFLAEDFYNPSAPYAAAVDVREAYEAARAQIGRTIGAKATNIIITAGATEANELALGGGAASKAGKAIGSGAVGEVGVIGGRRIFVFSDEHPSLLVHANARSISEADIVSVSLVNSETGQMRPIKEIADETHKAGALLHIDASQAATTCKLNVARLGADLMTLNSGKVYGPKQVGALYVKNGVKLQPLVRGGGQESGLRSGTENVAGVVGFATALTIAQEHTEAERKRLEKLKNIFKRELAEAKVEFLFDDKTQNAGFVIIETGMDAERLVFALENRGVLVGTGAACSANKREASKVLGGSALRISFGRLNDEKNVKTAAKIIAEEIVQERQRVDWRHVGGKKAIVGLSGGVDSTLAAALLLEQGYNVKGVYMKNWSRDLPGMRCPWKEDLADAKRVAVKLGIDFEVWDFEQQYYDNVVKTFVAGCEKGLTPNPDILCNEWIKFKLFLERAEAEGADYVATGHYSRILDGKLAIPKDLAKDQTYFLCRMPREALKKVLFPLGNYLKSEVKQMAAERGFRTAVKKESMGMCFVGEADFAEFLGEFIAEKRGKIVDLATKKVLGEHKGVAFYTLGQRHGLYLGGGAPYYVAKKDAAKNILYVARAFDLDGVDELDLRDFHLLVEVGDEKASDSVAGAGKNVQVRTRHLGELLAAEVVGKICEGGKAKIKLREKSRAVAAGQSVVLYDENGVCLGGGFAC